MAKITIHKPDGIPIQFPDANRVEVREGILTFYVQQDSASNIATKYSTNFAFMVEELIGSSGMPQ
jgi:hypothetical protein